MLISDQQNLDLKRLVNIQKCLSSTKVDQCAFISNVHSRFLKKISFVKISFF